MCPVDCTNGLETSYRLILAANDFTGCVRLINSRSAKALTSHPITELSEAPGLRFNGISCIMSALQFSNVGIDELVQWPI